MNAEVNFIVKRTLLPVFFCLSTAAFSQPPCDQIKSLAFPDTVITDATVVAAGPYQPAGAPAQAALQLPAYCRIAATLKPSSDSEIGIDQQCLPAEFSQSCRQQQCYCRFADASFT